MYLAGDDDPSWRLELLHPTVHEAYSLLTQTGGFDVLPDALPYGHTYVGPYTIRAQLEAGELERDANLQVHRPEKLQAGPERVHLEGITKADIVFGWVTMKCGIDFGIELGAAYASGKAVVLASPIDAAMAILKDLPMATEVAWKIHQGGSARDAYEWAMADLDVTFERGMAKIASKYAGRCVVCHSGYKEGDVIYWSKPKGAMHPDCYARAHDPNEAKAAVFNSELVHALRTENADLEKECLSLMTKNSMLQKETEELYAAYQKAVEGR